MNTLQDSLNKFTPAIKLESILSRRTMSILRQLSFYGALLFGVGAIITNWQLAGQYSPQLLGVSLILSAVWLEQILLFAFHNSYYFRNLNSVIGLEEENISGATYDVAKATLKKTDDVAYAFCTSTFGASVLIRAGLTQEQIDSYLTMPRRAISAEMVMLPEDEIFSLIGLGKYLLTHDSNFGEMLKNAGVLEKNYIGSLRWVIGSHHQEKRRKRWWSKDNLSKTNGVGREWSYGTAFLLEKFAKDIRTSAVFSTLSSNNDYASEKVSEIESALARVKISNVMLLGEAGVGKVDLLMEVEKRMRMGKSLDAISGKQLVVLDTNRIFAVCKDKQEFELTLIQMLDEATVAGNKIVVIENISNFIREAESIGVFLPELIDQYLALPQIQIVATDTPGAYHSYLEKLGSFNRRFAEILIDTPDLSATTRVLQNVALQNEMKFEVIFTYAALSAITTSADRYIVEGVMPDKAIELLVEISGKAKQTGQIIINEDFVYKTVSEKTSVPAGPIEESEKELLLHLEDRLHQQVVGQNKAIDAVARAMRRARAGIQSADKPIGSFLFLGPTGVGKTETAKALAKIFFGADDKMQRLDMSEFNDEHAVAKLIGNDEQTGTLSNMLREHPYCVLLLDEFEKSSQAVHDIFLQVLDEGIFTDGRGDKVNARNTIIIATSNAGSQLITKTVQQRKELEHLSAEIIDHIIREGIYRAELVNRFDSTIIFEPLSIEEQTEVASLMLKGLYDRISQQGYNVQVKEDLLHKLVDKGYDPEFGARPMQRVLQDVIEEKVAQKIISGGIKKGDTIKLSLADFTKEELSV